MYLKRLTINGFKSFANNTGLELEPGISAIVGPNGAGKSNVADAVRWVLGEQSARVMRAKKGEEVIFAGTEKRAKASLAEVSLLLDNTDGGLALDFSEVELVRRLYRSGESEYRLNGRKVALRDIQQLLIQAGFGPNSYAVIGQGMIDQLILASPAERKLLFDEASGIRGFELKREQAARKLEATDANLVRVRDILAELAPRLSDLSQAAEAAKARRQLAAELTQTRVNFLVSAETHYGHERLAAQESLAELAHQIKAGEQTVAALERQRAELTSRPPAQTELSTLHDLEARRDLLSNDLSVKRAELQFLLDKQVDYQTGYAKIADLEKDLNHAKRHRQGLVQAIAEAQVAESETSERLIKVTRTIDRMQTHLANLRRQGDQTSRHEYITQALTILKQVSHDLVQGTASQKDIRLLVYKAGRLLSHASLGQEDIAGKIRTAQADLMAAMKQREEAHEPYSNAVINLRSLELDLGHAEDQVTKLTDQLESFKQQQKQLQATERQIVKRKEHLAVLEKELSEINEQVQQLRLSANQQTVLQRDADEIFRLAAELEAAKAELASCYNRSHDIKALLDHATKELARVVSLRKSWFGTGRLPNASGDLAHPDELERKIELLAARISDTESRDQQVVEEYQEVTERYNFLSEQVTDLETAQLDLQTVVAALDQQIKAKFETAFAGLGRHFESYFKQLFGGGKAGLALVPDSTGSYGIEITAIPPGKRVESLATLSGGERALTGTALLAAILTVNPSPFVVLDEIDAALDEANSSRLSQILTDLAKHSQLIVITHNRQIMAAAKALYGVTMDQHHVSKVLSVHLETATRMAAR